MNDKSPFRLFNALSQKERDIFQALWPKMKERLQKQFDTKFDLDFDYVLYYDNQKATKQAVLDCIGLVFHQYYFSE